MADDRPLADTVCAFAKRPHAPFGPTELLKDVWPIC